MLSRLPRWARIFDYPGMEFPVMVRLGPLALHPHAVFESLAYIIGFQLYLWRRRRQADPIDSTTRLWVLLGAVVGAFLGSRLLAMAEHISAFGWNGWSVLLFFSSKTIVGGLLGGLLGVELMKARLGERRSTGDLYVDSLIVGIAVGRVGCFLTGVSDATAGMETSGPFGLDMGDGKLRHPTALYEIAFLLSLWLALGLLRQYRPATPLAAGVLFRMFMVAYLTFRWIIEFWKPVAVFFGVVSAIQLACMLGLAYYAVLFLREAFAPRAAD